MKMQTMKQQFLLLLMSALAAVALVLTDIRPAGAYAGPPPAQTLGAEYID